MSGFRDCAGNAGADFTSAVDGAFAFERILPLQSDISRKTNYNKAAMVRFSRWLQRYSTGWVALAALLIFVVFSVLALPRQSRPQGGEAGTPDLSLFYSKGDLYRWAEAYGEQGRQEYVRARFTFDVAWPLVYAFFLVTAISWLCGRAFEPDSGWQLANLAPVLGMSFDFLENIATSLVMGRFPQPTPVVDSLAAVFTLLKWGFIAASFLLLVAALGAAVWKRLFHR
jgi:hypothetical protein